MSFSKFAQEIYFYLLVVSLYLIQSKLKIFINSFISSRLPCPIINGFKSRSSRENTRKSCIFESNYFFWR